MAVDDVTETLSKHLFNTGFLPSPEYREYFKQKGMRKKHSETVNSDQRR